MAVRILHAQLVAEAYPSGRVIATSYDAANRPVQVAGTMASAKTVYLSGMTYAAHGAPAGYQYGNALTRQAKYNVRLQPNSTLDMLNNNAGNPLLALFWNWGTINNNGNLQSISQYNGGPGYSSLLQFVQSFSYDGVNRLTGASDSGGWSRTFQYDQYGNMWLAANAGAPVAGNTPTSNVYTGTNRIAGGSYDGAGNQTVVNGNILVYDAENHIVSVTEPANLGGGTETLAYDGAGHRVAKTMPSGQTVYVYDAFDQLAAEYSTVVPSVQPCTTCYLSMDHLGSTRLVTDANANVVTRHDFLPFGEELPPGYAGRNGQWAPGGDNVDQKFTGQVRDQETGLDYFNARYFGAALGRFTSPDPANAGADPMNPQSWNAYAYALNNPLVTVDPSGTDPSDDGGGDGGDDPCFWNPFLCGFSPLPPPIFVGGGGGRNNGASSGQPVDKTPLPPNSFPGGETLGLPPGMNVPNPLSPQVLLGLWSWDCSSGVCVPGLSGSDFAPPKTGTQNVLDKLKVCTAAQYGFGDGKTPTGLDLGKTLSEVGSLPIYKPLVGIPVIGDSSAFTNVLNYTSLKLGLNARFQGAALRSITKAAFGSVRIATVVGRANVVIGGALLAYDAASIAICTSR